MNMNQIPGPKETYEGQHKPARVAPSKPLPMPKPTPLPELEDDRTLSHVSYMVRALIVVWFIASFCVYVLL